MTPFYKNGPVPNLHTTLKRCVTKTSQQCPESSVSWAKSHPSLLLWPLNSFLNTSETSARDMGEAFLQLLKSGSSIEDVLIGNRSP